MLDKNILNLLVLIRIAITSCDKNVLSENIDWNNIFEISKKQGVSTIVFDALEKLSSDIRPSKPLLLQWIGLTTMTERMYGKHRERILSISGFYKKK